MRHLYSTLFISLTTVLILAASESSLAQVRKPLYSREIEVLTENDWFVFEDSYYTAGQEIGYRELLRSGSGLFKRFKSKRQTDSTKVIMHVSGGMKMFTPSDILERDTARMDRPYAGYIYGSFALSNFPSRRASNYYGLEVGVVGPASGADKMQEWLHQFARYSQANGWSTQIQNEVVVNLHYTRFQQIKLSEDADIVSESSVTLGTGMNALSQDLTFRVVQFLDLEQSTFANSRVSWDNRDQGRKRKKEFFLFVGMGITYVASNVFIQGSFFHDHPGEFTLPVSPWVSRIRYGFMFSQHNISYSFTIHHLSKEVLRGSSDAYAGVDLAYRF